MKASRVWLAAAFVIGVDVGMAVNMWLLKRGARRYLASVLVADVERFLGSDA